MPGFFARRQSSTSKSTLPTPAPNPPRPLSDSSSTSHESSASLAASSSPSSPSTRLSTSPTDTRQILNPTSTSTDPPSYLSAVAHTSTPVTYSFVQNSPFAMVLSSVSQPERPALYYISLGLSVWMPSVSVTYLRRGGDAHGPLVAQLEMGTSLGSANVVFAEESRPLGNVMFRKSANSSSRYWFTGDETIIRWKINEEEWEASANSLLLAKFRPSLRDRTLTVLHERGHVLLDHLVLALLVLMREHLTPHADATLFNYVSSVDGELANQEW